MIRLVLKECHFSYNDIASNQKDKQDIEVSFPKLIVCFRYTFCPEIVKIHIEFCGCAVAKEAKSFAECIAKINTVVDTPHLVIDCIGNAKHIDLLITKPMLYDIAKLCLLFTRYPILEAHEENIL